MSYPYHMDGKTLDWLLERDDPGVRYLTLRDLLGCPPDDPDLVAARGEAYQHGAIAPILDAMEPEGYWVKAGGGYNPKYQSTVWSIILLAQLGASVQYDARVARAATYLLDHALLSHGRFSATKTPAGNIDCLQGNLCAALLDLDCADPRLDTALEWMARSVTGDGIAPAEDQGAVVRYYASGKCAPGFACAANEKHGCAWGAVKVMLAFGKLPVERRTPLIDRATSIGVDFLFSTDPAGADYPHPSYTDKTSGSWFKFGFPVFYVSDVLQIVEALAALGYGRDPRLANALDLVESKRDAEGRWALEYDYAGKTWVEFGRKRQPNKWVTLRALKALSKVA